MIRLNFPNIFNKSFSSDGQSLSSKMLQTIHSDTEYLPRLSNPGSFFSFLIFFFSDDPEILSTLNPFVAIALTSEKRITLFPLFDILKAVHGYFFRGYFSDLYGLNHLQANTFSSFWTSLHENEKSSLVLGPTFSRKNKGCIPFSRSKFGFCDRKFDVVPLRTKPI